MIPRIVVMGASLGGLSALRLVLGGLPAQFPLPIAIVQHRSKVFPDLLATTLQGHTPLRVSDAEDKELLCEASVYIAPADYHLLLEPDRCALSLEGPVYHSRPSIDVLFESAADTYGADVIAVVLTGNSSDGAHGASRVKAAGGIVVVQDPDECEAPMMPMATINAVEADCVLKLAEIPSFLIQRCKREEQKNECR